MPLHVVAAVAALGLALPLLGWSLLAGRDPARSRVHENLSRGMAIDTIAAPTRSSGLGALARRFTRAVFIARLERYLTVAGRPPAWPLERLIVAKFALGGTGALVGAWYVSTTPGLRSVLMAAAVTVVAYFAPELLLYSRGKERQKLIQLELPDTLDQMTIAVEAGLGFESAMARAGKNGKGPLAQELVRTLQDIQVGQSRREAYLAMADRTTVTDLRRFIRAVVQADVYGTALGDVLRTQAHQMRLKRRQRAEEKAMKIPVKVIFPLILCILPTLFIVLLGPAVIDIMDAFSGGGP